MPSSAGKGGPGETGDATRGGDIPTSFIVVDDFLGNAEEVRAAALKLDYPEPDGAVAYSGRNSRKRLRIEGLDQEISRLVGEPLTPTPNTGHGACRIALADDKGANAVHVDESHWSGVLYLSRPEDCAGGTDFFRHRATGAEKVPDLAAQGFTSFQQVIDRVLDPDAADLRKWERVLRVPMRFNRLVLFRPWFWHSAGPGFGDCLENGRLVYLLFLNAAAAPAASR